MTLKHKLLAIIGVGLLLGSCSSLPDHARYIPKDAVVVAGINFKSLSKKIAWNVITGSKLFKEMQKRLPEKNANDAVSGIEKSGIDFINTFYCYVKTDKRLKGGNRVAVLIPLSDANDFENYVKKIFPNVAITQKGERKEAGIGNIMYIGWTKKLLIVTNTMADAGDYYEAFKTVNDAKGKNTADNTENSAEMDNAFTVTKENSILGNQHFKMLETNGHDVTLWMNYDQLMSQYMNESVADKMGGLTLSNTLWKDAAFAGGFDFKAGKITGDMNYYVSEEMKEIGTDLGAVSADKDMIAHLPLKNMDLLMSWHLSPTGIKKSVEKTGLLGLVNIGMGTQGLSFDNALDAFTGDMAIVMNNLSVKNVVEEDDLMGQRVKHTSQKPDLDMTFVIKINKKDNFMKIFDMYKDAGGLMPIGKNGYTVPINTKDSVFIMMNDKYVVASNKHANVIGFLDGTFTKDKIPDAVSKQVMGHPLGLLLDIQQCVSNIDATIVGSSRDSAIFIESKKLLNYLSVNGGEFKNNSFESHLDINFTNTDENSIIELMDYGMKLSDADKLNNENKH